MSEEARAAITTARIEGARLGIEAAAADVKTWFPGDTINSERSSAGRALYDSILALDPATIVKGAGRGHG